MENNILDAYSFIVYEDYVNELYKKRVQKIDYPVSINIKLDFKLIYNFNKKYFAQYEEVLLINSLVFAIENNDEYFKNLIVTNIDNIKELIQKDLLFKAKITEYALKNIILKSKTKDTKNIFNKSKNKKTINTNSIIFEKISRVYSNYYTIFKFYRKILFDFLKDNRDYIDDVVSFLEVFLTTNSFDKELLESSNYITKDNIKYFKYIIVKMIFSSNYILSEISIDELEESEMNENQESYNFDNYNVEDYINIKEYIEECIDNNDYILP